MSLLDAFKSANDVLLNAVQGISELITKPGLINVDFADVRTVMSEMGIAMMGSGNASGEKRAREAAEIALQSPLLEDINLAGAKGVLVNITAGMDMSIGEFDEVGSTVREYADDDATVVVGTVIDAEMHDELRVTVVATGIGGSDSASRQKPHVEVVKPARVANSDVVAEATQQAPESGSATTKGSGYSDYDNPTVIRKSPDTPKAESGASQDMDYLDIPAFLRRQAD
jgi:cell division protein FtsZ